MREKLTVFPYGQCIVGIYVSLDCRCHYCTRILPVSTIVKLVTFYEREPTSIPLVCVLVDESGWAVFAKGSVNGSRYTMIDTPMTFYAGQERCQRLGGHLVHVNTLREQLFLEDFIGQMLQATDQLGTNSALDLLQGENYIYY